MPTPGKPMLWISVAMPQANRSALIRKATSSGDSLSARPRISGTATAPAYMTSTCCRPRVSSLGIGKDLVHGMWVGAHGVLLGPWRSARVTQEICQSLQRGFMDDLRRQDEASLANPPPAGNRRNRRRAQGESAPASRSAAARKRGRGGVQRAKRAKKEIERSEQARTPLPENGEGEVNPNYPRRRSR